MTRRLVAVLLGALVVGGCSAEADPTPEPSESPSTTPSRLEQEVPEQPELVLPEQPPGLNEQGVDGALAASEYFLALISYAYGTGDVSSLEQFSDEECVYCASVLADISELHNSGGYLVTSPAVVRDISAQEVEPGTGVFRVDLVVVEQSSTRVMGGTTEESPGGEHQLRMVLTNYEGSWEVAGVEIL